MKQKTLKLDLKSIEDDVEISDGYHTFDELYDHRITLYIALCRTFAFHYTDWRNTPNPVWRSKTHSDGSKYESQFILGIHKGLGIQITYHIPNERWDETEFAETLEQAPIYDGHTATDVLKRIKSL